jgi:hypothetical protein
VSLVVFSRPVSVAGDEEDEGGKPADAKEKHAGDDHGATMVMVWPFYEINEITTAFPHNAEKLWLVS